LGRYRRVQPASLDPVINPGIYAFRRRFGVDIALPHDAAESLLDMGAGAAEPVVKIEMAEGGIKIIAPEQANDPAAEPDAFRVAGRASDQFSGLGEFIASALAIFTGLASGASRSFRIPALGQGGVHGEGQNRRAKRDR
jgi:hypothetical protein